MVEAMETDSFSDRTILIVGGAGFVGSNLVARLLEANVARIVVIDNLLSSEHDNLPDDPRVEFRLGSITDDRILAGVADEFDYIFHLATYHGNQSSIHNPLADHENNTLTTLKLFWHVRDFCNLKKVVYSAAGCAVAKKTDTVATATEECDTVSLDMDSPYSISKIVGEFYSVYFHSHHRLPVVRARFQNVYGPGELLGAGEWRGTPATVWRNVTPTFIYKSLHGQALPLENEGLGSRDFIFVDDICRGLMLCAFKGQAGDVYNLASGNETTIRQLADTINRITGNPEPCALLPKRSWDNSVHRFGSPDKSRQTLGFQAEIDLETGLERTIAWTYRNLPRIEAAIERHRAKLIEASKEECSSCRARQPVQGSMYNVRTRVH
jgi:nucleoside-diphosphate-sugar epimerase